MSHVEYIEKLIDDLLKNFSDNPCDDKEISAFRTGAIWMGEYIVQSLKNPINFEKGEK